jgi:hypothetical protein
MPSIFVTIPAYEDPLLAETIKQALSNASNPENITFAIALQYKNTPIPDISQHLDQCKIVSYNVDSRPGVNLVRAELLDLYDGQDYFLMIDSHTVFAKNWDSDLINELLLLGPKSIISKQVANKAGDISMHNNLINERTIWTFDQSLPGGVSGMIKGYPQPHKYTDRVIKTHYASFHFFFTYGSFIDEIGISKINNHYAEEPLLAYQCFLAGWDIYAIANYNHIGHNDLPYNKAIYNSEIVDKPKIWGVLKDSQDIVDNINLFFTDHASSKFAIKNSKRTTKEFYKSIGLYEDFLQLLPALDQIQ